MLRPKSSQSSFYDSYIYDRIIPRDHLSGTSLVTSDNGTSLGNMKYYAFGVCRNSPDNFPTDRLFTGQRLDDTGLYYYGARYYDATIGRFISADTIIPNPANPQSFNRYSYCLNNPLKYVDPSGHDAYMALLQYYRNQPQIKDYVTGGDPVSQIYGYSWYNRDYTAWQAELNTIQEAYGVTSVTHDSQDSANSWSYVSIPGEAIGSTWTVLELYPGIEISGNMIYNSNIKGGSRYFHLDVGKHGTYSGPHFNADIGPLKGLNGRPIPASWVKYAKPVAKGVVVVGLAVDTADLVTSLQADDWNFGENTQHAVGRVGGGWGGAIACAAVGTAIGGPVGGIIGGIIGAFGGSFLGDWLADVF